MLTPEFYKALEERLGPVVSIAASAAIVLNTLGYLSLRFRMRALGLDPELGLVSEAYLFEGASLIFFLLALLPVLLGLGLVATLLLVALRRHAAIDRRWSAVVDWLRTAPPAWAASIGAIWSVVTVQFFLRHILGYNDMIHRGVPCDPNWLAVVATSRGLVEGVFFSILLLLPIPTLWAVDRLSDCRGWRPATMLLGLVALTQILLVPIHHGVLIGHRSIPRLILPDAEAGTTTWEVFRTSDHYHLMTQDSATPPTRRLRTVPNSDLGTVEIDAMDPMFEILMTARRCPGQSIPSGR